MDNIYHVLPGEPGGESTWFKRQNPFEQEEIRRQVAFKRGQWQALGNGKFAKLPQHIYPHILPDGCEKFAFYPAIAASILNYLQKEDIALHTEALNLKSSQVACFNFLFPLRQDPALAAEIFRPFLPELDRVTDLKFEYTGPAEATAWLGEPPTGKRGQNRTSIDAAVFWTSRQGKSHATLIEWKYTEHNFGVCSAYAGGSKAACKALNPAHDPHPEKSCKLCGGTRHCSRHYWEHMAGAGICLSRFEGVQGCPFQGPFYQLMRQYLLAACPKLTKCFDEVDVVSIGFSKNKALASIPRQLMPLARDPSATIVDVWNSILTGVPPLRHILVEDLMKAVDQAKVVDPEWRDYLRSRYGV
jgi:hypothetical protein